MNVVFLDVDGVLNAENSTGQVWGSGTYMQYSAWIIDPVLVERLNRISKEVNNLTIVLSSSWRYAEQSGHIDINNMLEEKGYVGPKIIERTICDDENEEAIPSQPRGKEIQRWLDEHPEVENFVILDDDDDMAHLMPNLIQTSFEDGGLLDKHVDEAIRRLQ
tara:strand:- start:57648 stop:58133 length:486 start_codon:yes stop_codon:yes gene_type:complete